MISAGWAMKEASCSIPPLHQRHMRHKVPVKKQNAKGKVLPDVVSECDEGSDSLLRRLENRIRGFSLGPSLCIKEAPMQAAKET